MKEIYRFCKALASIVIICPKKFLQKSVDHPSNIQPPAVINRFEGFARGENYVFSRITFTEVNCMPSKLNYFVYKEQSTISSNHFNSYLEVVKEGCDV